LTWQAVFELFLGNPATGRDVAREALADARAVGDLRKAARALRALAMATDDNDATGRVAVLEKALALARVEGGADLVAVHLAWLAAAVAETGDLERARTLAEESCGLARTGGDPWRRVLPSTQLGWLAIAENRLNEAESYFLSALELTAGWGGGAGARYALIGLGQVSLQRGDLEQARALHRRVLRDLVESTPESITLADALVDMASVEAAAGLQERAQRLLGANEAWYSARGGAGLAWQPMARSPLTRPLLRSPIPQDGVLAQARAEGRAMSLDKAVAYALEPVEESLDGRGVDIHRSVTSARSSGKDSCGPRIR
jgi:tetratricopeptide (TPR) repeat protein